VLRYPIVNTDISELVVAYIGQNDAHKSFRVALANAKALAFVLARGDSTVLRDFLTYAAEMRQKFAGPDFAFGVCGGPNTTTTIHLGVAITGTEINLIQAEEGGFKSQALGLIYREVHRVFETYLIDLFEEIARRDKRVLYSNQKISHEDALRASDPVDLQRFIIENRKAELSRVGFEGLEKTFDNVGLPIITMLEPPPRAEQEEIRGRLIYLSAVRNVIEHNRSIVNQEFVDLVPTSRYRVGERIVIDTTELGDALRAVEWTVDRLNRRAIEKFGIR
jgi:hypothetical protein